MPEISSTNKRIAKNALLLYFRMLFMMLVSLYTSRVVLATLGVEDFGIYNVVGGVITMFSFFNGAMSSSTQRYITFELGRGDFDQLQKVFQTSVNIHLLVALLILFLGETIGLWFFYEKMVIPASRMTAAFWVYQFSIITMMVMIVSVPYNAAIIAHEKMSIFAYISILEVLLKLGIVYLLYLTRSDKLIMYAALLCATQLLICIVYGHYCSCHFKEVRYYWGWDLKLFKEMLYFGGWNLWGGFATVLFSQGINILLNMFFGPFVNAARGIAVQVQGAVTQFSTNFQTALNPQITKSYALGDFTYMHSLIFRSSKFTFLLLAVISFPILLETEMILQLWLNMVPAYTVVFVRLMLCITIIDAMGGAFMVAAQSTGRVRFYQSVVGGILLAIVPVSYVVLRLGAAPWSVFLIHFCVCTVAFFVRLFIIRSMIHLSLYSYFHAVLLRCLYVLLLAMPLPIGLLYIFPATLWAGISVCFVSVLTISLSSYRVGLAEGERKFIKEKIRMFLSKSN
ncbi:lipopolysaccharide biosynthesis protein [Phocaeicola vulgatus]|uniref:lipopolysaccharide biosynthesis protein n=1 Tax=Phocaeicola vulgatus TaxID=821 RepID=UPI00321C1604